MTFKPRLNKPPTAVTLCWHLGGEFFSGRNMLGEGEILGDVQREMSGLWFVCREIFLAGKGNFSWAGEIFMDKCAEEYRGDCA